jgi:hypothetical protein
MQQCSDAGMRKARGDHNQESNQQLAIGIQQFQQPHLSIGAPMWHNVCRNEVFTERIAGV